MGWGRWAKRNLRDSNRDGKVGRKAVDSWSCRVITAVGRWSIGCLRKPATIFHKVPSD